jgi:hypothetical protein
MAPRAFASRCTSVGCTHGYSHCSPPANAAIAMTRPAFVLFTICNAATPLGLMMMIFDWFTQGSSFLATAGLNDVAPLGQIRLLSRATSRKVSVLSIDNSPSHFVLSRLLQYSRCARCVLVPIPNRFAIHARVIVVSQRIRCAIFTFSGSPLGRCSNTASIQCAFIGLSCHERVKGMGQWYWHIHTFYPRFFRPIHPQAVHNSFG